MSTVLLDTDVVSYLFKRDSRRQLYAPHLLNRELAIAIMTVAELFQWASMRRWGETRVQMMEAWLERFTILPVDMETCRVWAAVRAHRAALGLPISPQDAWIAATALRYQIPLVTHNAGDYRQIPELTVISER
jgi:predicted nucleic acid-binding protein